MFDVHRGWVEVGSKMAGGYFIFRPYPFTGIRDTTILLTLGSQLIGIVC